MAELGFQGQGLLRFGLGDRDASPDSVIFTQESNFSLFSSASASVDRCSFASDVHDHESLASEISQHLAGPDLQETSGGPDLGPNKATVPVHKHSRLIRKEEKAKALKPDKEIEAEEENLGLDSARNSFSLALKECQERRSRSEALSKKHDRRRPASLDLNNANSSSPRLGGMKKSSASSRKSGTFPSPGTPNYRHSNFGIQKGWSSERVPLNANATRRHVSAALLPFNNGRTLPSKWEDAERWIFSPVAGDGVVKPSLPPPQRRPKSKSGPLGPPGVAYYSLYSPAITMFEGGNAGNFMVGSPFSAGVIAPDGWAIHCGGRGGVMPMRTEPCMGRSASVHGCPELLNQSSLPESRDEKFDGIKDAATDISRTVSRRDMATQMSPEGSIPSSPERKPSFSPSSPSILPIVELQSANSSKLEIRDVQVDELVTMTRWSKKHRGRIPGKDSENVESGWKKKAAEACSSAWEVSETAKSISKVKREEAKITAWENLQKAKAEAAIRKLEMEARAFNTLALSHLNTWVQMKLEKKRSSSMDKIMNKLRSAQRKAQEMRSSVLTNQAHQVSGTSQKAVSFHITRQKSSLSGCFTCHAF